MKENECLKEIARLKEIISAHEMDKMEKEIERLQSENKKLEAGSTMYTSEKQGQSKEGKSKSKRKGENKRSSASSSSGSSLPLNSSWPSTKVRLTKKR